MCMCTCTNVCKCECVFEDVGVNWSEGVDACKQMLVCLCVQMVGVSVCVCGVGGVRVLIV